MKKVFYLLFSFLFLLSCKIEESKSIVNSSNFEFKNLNGSKIAFENGGKLVLNVSSDKILETFRIFNSTLELGLEPQRFEVIKIDNKDYLRFFSKNNKVSTISLVKGEDNNYRTGSTVCTSTAFAIGKGCIPNGDYCIKSRPEGTPSQAPSDDCKRTTTSFES